MVFISILFATAFAINQSLNETNSSQDNLLDITPDSNLTPDVNISINVSIEVNQTENIGNQSIINETLPAVNETKEEIDLERIAEQHKDKLNEKTKEYLKTIKNKKEEKDYIIKFKESINKDKLAKISLKEEHSKFNAATIEGKAEDIGELVGDSDIEYLELDQNIEALSDNIPYGIEKTNAPNAWNTTKGNGIKVAILDTGVSSHSDLYVVDGTSIVSNDYDDNHGHGTSVAGVLSAIINDEGLAGVAPEAGIYAVKIMEGSSGSLSDAIEGVEWSINNDMDIVSMSFGMETYSQIFKEILEQAYSEGILLIAASGNTGENNILYPAAYTDVIAVGAVDENNERASFSNYGFELELVAAGVDVNSTALGNSYSVHSGTSLAVPHVAGVAALIKAYNNSLTNEQIRTKLRNDALDLGAEEKDDYYGYGLVQINLESSNHTQENLSYFYEVFNITNYGTKNQEYLFWLNGTGAIDDVTFSEGYYLVKKYIGTNVYENKYRVDENGTLKILWTVGFYDDFTTESSTDSDGKGWVSNILNLYVDDPIPLLDAECYDFDDDGGFEECYYDTGDFSDCCTYSSGLGFNGHAFYDICCTEGGTCAEGIGNNHSSPNATKIGEYSGNIVIYEDCDDSSSQQAWDEISEWYYLFDKKRALCTGSTTFDYQGRWSTAPNWQIYKSTSCPSGYTCDYSLDEQEVSTKTGTIPSPCVSDTSKCNGTINVYSQYSDGIPVNGSYIYFNGASNGTTDINGIKTLDLDLVSCGQSQNISVYCYNNQSKLCGTKKTSLDFNGDSDSLFFDCNLCKSDKNLKIEVNDISLKLSSGSSYTITTTVHSQNIEASNVNVTVKGQGKDTSLIEDEKSTLITSVTNSQDYNATVTMDLSDINYLYIYVDPNNKVAEPKTDNYILMPVVKKKLKANLSINTNYDKVDSAIKNYLSFYIDDVSQSQANAIVAIGKNTNERIAYNSNTLKLGSNPFGVSGSQINTKTGSVKNPYAGIIGSYQPVGSKPIVFIYGNRIEGTIAALKEFISARDVFLSDNYYNNLDQLHGGSKLVILDDYDTTAIGVFDLMHNAENNLAFSNLNSQSFADVVYDILNGNNFEISIKTVKTTNDNTTLRLKHANTDYSSNFQDAVVGTQKPVVLSRGIHSNLLTWNDFATDLATNSKNARDTWLIEMVGGPTIDEDCDTYNCPNYNFSDLKIYYWPALIAGVEEYSGQNTIDYVGYSLGCSAALESLELYGSSGKNNAGYCFNTNTGLYEYCDLASNPIDTFVAVACPGNFSFKPAFINALYSLNKNFNLIESMKNKGETHITQSDIKNEIFGRFWYLAINEPTTYITLKTILSKFFAGNKMSIEIYEEFINWMDNPNSPKIGENVQISNFMMIQGNFLGMNSDTIVPNDDTKEVCKNINSNNKYYLNFDNKMHMGPFELGLADSPTIQRVVREYLANNRLITQNYIDNYVISTQQTCEP